MIDQAIIFVTGPLSIWLANDPRQSHRKWACIAAMIGQPSWLYAAYVAGQWGILVTDILFTLAWMRGVREHWVVHRGETEMSETLDPEDMGSGMLANAARFEKYRPAYNKMVIKTAEEGGDIPEFKTWATEQEKSDKAKQSKTGVIDRLRKFVAR